MILRLKRTPGLYLIGFMGCGKTTIGQALAHRIGWHFVDLDHDIEETHGGAIQQIFRDLGELHFRQLEHAALKVRVREVESGKPMVVALGGGAFVQPDNYALLEEHGVTIWLDAPFEMIRRRVPDDGTRPLAIDPAKFEALYNTRRAQYQRADHRVEILSEDPEATVDAIVALRLFGV